VNRIFCAASIAVSLLTLSATAAIAHTADSDTHNDAQDYGEPVLFDGTVITDCAVIGADMILWELTGSAQLTYAELHIDTPKPSVTARNAAPYIWVTPRYDFALIDADADRIVGDIDANAQLIATICDDNDTVTSTPWLPYITGVVGAALGVIGGRRFTRS